MGYGGASSSGGARGAGGSGGAFGDRLGLSTGTTMYGNVAYGQPGGMASGYATRQSDGSLGNYRDMQGNPFGQRSLPSPGGYIDPVISQPIPPRRPGYVPPPVAPPTLPPTVARPYVGIPRPVTPSMVNFNPSLPQFSWMQSAVQTPHRSQSTTGAYGSSYYNNPTLGTPGFGTGLGQYAGYNAQPAGMNFAKDQSRVP